MRAEIMPYVIGLTGGIGSGKTVVSDHFAELGVPVIDTDVIARVIVEPGQPALNQLAEAFGHQILSKDGYLDRTVLRKIAFSNDTAKATLDSITHPAIGTETLTQIANVTFPYCIVVVPLLTADSQFAALMQRVLVVTADHMSKVKRVQLRSDLTADEVETIMRTQLTDAQRLQFADDVIENNGSISDAHARTEELHKLYQELSQD